MSNFGNVEREELGNKTQIERLLEEIKTSAIGFENYKSYFEKVKNSDQVILTQIENLVREFREYKTKHDEATNMSSNKQMKEDGYIRIEIYEDALMMNKILKEAYAWKTLQEELYNIIFNKISGVLDDARALDIKRDALKEMREMEERRNSLLIEIVQNMSGMFRDEVGNRLKLFDEKFVNLIMMIDEDNRRDKKETFDAFRKIIEHLNIEKKQILKEDDENDESKIDRLNKKFPERKEEKTTKKEEKKPSQKQINLKAKIDDIDQQFDSMDENFDDDKYDNNMN